MEIRDVCVEALSADLKAKRGIQREVFVISRSCSSPSANS